MHYILEARNISKSFSGVKALDAVNLAVRPGSVHAVVGENGAGKSTLMKILSGVYTQYEGEILLDGKPVIFAGPRDAAAQGIAVIHQELTLVPALSVAENIFLGREFSRYGFVDHKRLNREATELLSRLGHPVDPRQPVSNLKVSDQQIVEIARALSLNARIIIMDEPTSALAASDINKLFEIIGALTRLGKAVIYISHKMDELFRIADEITVLRDGKLVGTRPAAETTPGELVRMMVGREISQFYSSYETKIGGELLRVENLSSRDKGASPRKRLSNISFSLRAGEILGIAGLMGSGRTELLESLFGLYPTAPSTRIFLEGNEVHLSSPAQAIQSGIAFVTEDRKQHGLILNMTVSSNITLTVLKQFTRFSFIRNRQEEDNARQFIAKLGIKPPELSTLAENLSGGNQQKVVLAKWLMTAPKILLLDEPTKGIDIAAKSELYRSLKGLASEGIGIILVSSEMPELLSLSDRILVMREGALTGALSRSEASEEKIIEMATIASNVLRSRFYARTERPT